MSWLMSTVCNMNVFNMDDIKSCEETLHGTFQFKIDRGRVKCPGGGTHMLDATGVLGRHGYLFHKFHEWMG